jgi:N6-adenosine-specific RNA methylase IME4
MQGRIGRPPIGKKAMTEAQRSQRYRDLRNPNSRLYRQLAKKQRRKEREAELFVATEAAWRLGDRRFPVLYVDWPSHPDPYSLDTGMDRHAANHYPAMSLAEVLAFPLLPAADNSVIFMWIIAEWFGERYPDTGHMQAILAKKGFQYRAHCIWDKGEGGADVIGQGTGQMGLGHWFRYEHEVLVVGARGEIPAPAQGTQWRSVIHHPRLRLKNGRIDHSRKPEIFATMITEYFPTAPKLEMFYRALEDPGEERVRRAKREAAGWFFFGNEVEAAA